MEFLLDGFRAVTWQQGVMYLVGFALIYLTIQKDYEPALLLPMGFGAILVNLPSSGVLNQMVEGIGESHGIIQWLFETTIEASEALPLLLFIGIGAMIDFGPLLSNPKMLLFGAADGPTSILVSQVLHSSYVGPIAVAAYSYMALVPIIQPFAIKLVTTKKERRIRMPYNPKNVSRTLRICFPILVTIIAGFIGFAMGATSNAMANMQVVTKKYGPSPVAYFAIPMVGGMFIDFFNAVLISANISWWA